MEASVGIASPKKRSVHKYKALWQAEKDARVVADQSINAMLSLRAEREKVEYILKADSIAAHRALRWTFVVALAEAIWIVILLAR